MTAPDEPLTRLALRVWRMDPRTRLLKSLNAPTGAAKTFPATALALPKGAWPHPLPGDTDPMKASGLIIATCAQANRRADEETRHVAPDPDCTCGIYAATDLEVVNAYLSEDAPVLGMVELGGRVIDAEQGIRAQSARVAMILLIDPMFTLPHVKLRQVAAAYRVPAIVPTSVDPEEYRPLITARGLTPGMAFPVRCHPVTECGPIQPKLTCHLSDRARGLHHHLGGFLLEFRREITAFLPSHSIPSFPAKILLDPRPESSGHSRHLGPAQVAASQARGTVNTTTDHP